jgi:hypothetical protein
MFENTLVPRGQKVVCSFPISDMRKERILEKGCTYTEDDNHLYLECFVSGHTKELGLSLVALENPEYCLTSWTNPSDEYILSMLQGYYNEWCINGGAGIGNPVCQFN